MIWKTRLMTLYSVSRVNHPQSLCDSPASGSVGRTPADRGGAVERSEMGGAPKASVSARRNDKCANIWTQKARFASVSAHGRRFGAHLRTQITFIYATSDGTISIGATWLCNTTHSSEPPSCIWWRLTATALVEGGLLFGFPANRHKTAMASISTRAPLGMSLPPMATRAGLTEPMNTSAYRASTSLKSSTFFM